MDNRYNRHNRRKYSLKVHVVLVTKYRKQLLKGSIADDVKQKIYDICNSYKYSIIAMETDVDHIHILIGYEIHQEEKPKDVKKVASYHGKISSKAKKKRLHYAAFFIFPNHLLLFSF